MAENSLLSGSANGLPAYFNGDTMSNGVLTPRVNAKGVVSYSDRPAASNNVPDSNSETNGSIHTMNPGPANFPITNGVVPCCNGTACYYNGVVTASGFFTPSFNEVVNIHNLNGSKGVTGKAVPIVNGVSVAAESGIDITTAVKESSTAIYSNGTNGVRTQNESFGIGRRRSLWYEEEVSEDLRWCFSLCSILHTGVSEFQEIALLDTRPFGKVLILDGKLQSAEADEFVYHECLVHPALLYHSSPKKIFIMGGGEGSAAREALRHRSVQSVVMCDIDKEVVEFCSAYLTPNKEAFHNSRVELVINDARAELESRKSGFDVIIGDLADPMEGGPCYQLYSMSFYEHVVKPRLNSGGILVTQAGPAGVWSHGEVFSSIYNTLRHVFKYVIAYTAHIPSYADTWGWVMASDHPFSANDADELDGRISQRIIGELRYLDGPTICASTVLNKLVRRTLSREKHLYTEDSARFVYGRGRALH